MTSVATSNRCNLSALFPNKILSQNLNHDYNKDIKNKQEYEICFCVKILDYLISLFAGLITVTC